MWVYFETPEFCVCVYSAKGYGVGSNGGIEVFQWRGYIFKSRTAYCIRRQGDEEFDIIGKTDGRSSTRFRKRLAKYVSDDPVLAGIDCFRRLVFTSSVSEGGRPLHLPERRCQG